MLNCKDHRIKIIGITTEHSQHNLAVMQPDFGSLSLPLSIISPYLPQGTLILYLSLRYLPKSSPLPDKGGNSAEGV